VGAAVTFNRWQVGEADAAVRCKHTRHGRLLLGEAGDWWRGVVT